MTPGNCRTHRAGGYPYRFAGKNCSFWTVFSLSLNYLSHINDISIPKVFNSGSFCKKLTTQVNSGLKIWQFLTLRLLFHLKDPQKEAKTDPQIGIYPIPGTHRNLWFSKKVYHKFLSAMITLLTDSAKPPEGSVIFFSSRCKATIIKKLWQKNPIIV